MARSTTLNVVVAGDTQGLDRALQNAVRNLDKFSRDAETHSKRTAIAFGAIGGAAASGLEVAAKALVGIGVSVIKTAANFQSAMNEVKAVSGATEKQMQQLSKAALDIGTATGIGATQAAKAIGELAKGGLSAKQIIGGGLKGAIALAQAGSLDLAEAASTTANALNLFGLQGSKATHVADALATAANATTADVRDFGMALAAGGSAAKAAGLSFNQTTVALEALAAIGIKNSDAGTSLKTALTYLAKPTKQAREEMHRLNLEFFDGQGKILPLIKISAELRDRFGKLSQQQRLQAAATIAGTDGMRTLLALYNVGPKRLKAFQDGLQKQGSAAEVARQKNAGLQGATMHLHAAFEALQIELGRALLPTVTKVINAVTRFITQMNTGKGAGADFAHAMHELGTVLQPVVHWLSVGVTWFGKHKLAVQAAIAPVTKLIAEMRGLEQAIKDVVGAVNAVVHAVKSIPGIFKSVTGAIPGLGKSILGFGDGLGQAAKSPPIGSAHGNSLMGANPILAPFAGIASGFGLRTSSGERPGAITVSGNKSYHSSGYAIDEAGSPPEMLQFFDYMRSHYGPVLRELIYTPGGLGIKDGHPYRYTGAVAAEHYNHVHVAYTGPFGDGLGQIENLWGQAGGKRSAAAMAAAIAMAESSGQPGISHRNSDGSIDRGLWQINSTHGALSTFNPLGNARAAVQISGNGSNWSPWTTYTSGAYRRFLSAARAALGSSGGSGLTLTGSSGQQTVGHGSSGGMTNLPGASPHPFTVDPNSPIGQFTLTQSAASGRTGPVKGRLIRKGNTPDQQAFYSSLNQGAASDPNQPLIDAQNAAAAAAQALTDALTSIEGEMQRGNDIAQGLAATDNYQLLKYVADMFGGFVIGRGVVPKSFTPGTGVEVAY